MPIIPIFGRKKAVNLKGVMIRDEKTGIQNKNKNIFLIAFCEHSRLFDADENFGRGSS